MPIQKQKIDFTGNLGQQVKIFFIIEKAKEIVLYFHIEL